MTLFPDAAPVKGRWVVVKCDSGPGQLNPDLLAYSFSWLHSLSWRSAVAVTVIKSIIAHLLTLRVIQTNMMWRRMINNSSPPRNTPKPGGGGVAHGMPKAPAHSAG